MSSNLVLLPFEFWPDPTRAKPLAGGLIYVGEPGLDPELNPIDIFYVIDGCTGCTAPASNPVPIGPGGVVLNNGFPVRIAVNQNYSMRVRDSKLAQAYFVSDSSDSIPNNEPFDTVADMKAAITFVDSVVETKGYYAIGDGGAGTYINRGQGSPIIQDAGALIHHIDADGNLLELQFDKELNFLQAGGKGDWDRGTLTGSDNTPILQNAIDYLFPFIWQGSVAATNAVLRTFSSGIFIPTPEAKYMLSDVVKLNPHTSIVGPDIERSFGMDLFSSNPVGAYFVPNFGATKQVKYVFDAAPFNSLGVRETSTTIAFTNNDRDTGVYTAVDAVVIKNILICPDVDLQDNNTGDIHYSPLRLFGSSHIIKQNYWSQTVHGPSFQACWDYDYDGNLAQTFDSALSIFEGTVGNIGGINYCNSIGDRIRYGNVIPAWWVDEDGDTFITGDFDQPTSLVIRDVTSGRVHIGTWIQEKYNRSYAGQNASFYIEMAHSESIEESLVAFKGCNVEFKAGKTFLPSNRLFRPIGRFGGGAKVTFAQFDFGCTGPLASYIEQGVEINLLRGCIATDAADATPNQGLINTTPFTIRNDGQGMPTVFYEEFDRRTIKEIFVNKVSGLKSDTYYGFDDQSAMENLEAAIERVLPNQNALIKIRNASTGFTNETFVGQPTLTDASITLSLRFDNRAHTVTGLTFLSNSSFSLGTGMIFNGAFTFQLDGSNTIEITGDALIDSSSNVFIVAANKAAKLVLLKSDTAAFTTNGGFTDNASILSVDFMNASTSSAIPAGNWGSGTKVL